MNGEIFEELKTKSQQYHATLVAVSKTKSVQEIAYLYQLGQYDFGENYVQELLSKHTQLPKDIRWHFIGHLQRNKVKDIAAFVHLIHAVDSFKLLLEINKEAQKHERCIDVLLQLHVAQEDSKYGMDENEMMTCLEYYEAQKEQLQHVRIRGLMGMATFTDDTNQIRKEFKQIHTAFKHFKKAYFLGKPFFDTCSMGMSTDYNIAIEEGSTLIRIGSLLFGSRY